MVGYRGVWWVMVEGMVEGMGMEGGGCGHVEGMWRVWACGGYGGGGYSGGG